MRLHLLLVMLLLAGLGGCSSEFWYNQIQFGQYDKCEKLASAEDRRRCKAETYPDKDKYDKAREGAKGASK